MESTILDEVTEKLVPVLRKHLRLVNDDYAIPLDVSLEELGLDSLCAINLLLDLEDTFEIYFPESMLTEKTFRTALTLQNAIRTLING